MTVAPGKEFLFTEESHKWFRKWCRAYVLLLLAFGILIATIFGGLFSIGVLLAVLGVIYARLLKLHKQTRLVIAPEGLTKSGALAKRATLWEEVEEVLIVESCRGETVMIQLRTRDCSPLPIRGFREMETIRDLVIRSAPEDAVLNRVSETQLASSFRLKVPPV